MNEKEIKKICEDLFFGTASFVENNKVFANVLVYDKESDLMVVKLFDKATTTTYIGYCYFTEKEQKSQIHIELYEVIEKDKKQTKKILI